MLSNRETLLCRYAYDPLDRLVDCTPSAQAAAQRFYMKDRVASEIQGTVQRSIMQHNDQLLAQKQRQGSTTAETSLLATDQQRSVLNVLDPSRSHSFAYTPYGHHPAAKGLLSLLGFNGEPPDPVSGCYLLGNGYRAFNPVLMRFNSPDSWSPFGEGGLNSYAYCYGDPSNRSDPTGHKAKALWAALRNNLKFLIGNGEQVTILVLRPLKMTARATKRSAGDAFQLAIKEIPIQKVAPIQRTPVLAVQSTLSPNLQNSIVNQTANSATIANQHQANQGTSALMGQSSNATSRLDIERGITIRTLTDSGYSPPFIMSMLNRNLRVTRSPRGTRGSLSRHPRNSGADH